MSSTDTTMAATIPKVGTYWKRSNVHQPVRVIAVIEDRYVVARYLGGFPFIDSVRDFQRNYEPCPPAKSHRAAIVAAKAEKE